MSHRIIEPQRFAKDGETDAFEIAAEWIDMMQSEGWQLITPVLALGTVGHVILTGPEKSNLIFRHSSPRPTTRKKTK